MIEPYRGKHAKLSTKKNIALGILFVIIVFVGVLIGMLQDDTNSVWIWLLITIALWFVVAFGVSHFINGKAS